MATTKTLKPTNVMISIPEFTDQPDQRVNSNCIDKEADAINALSEQIANLDFIRAASSSNKTSHTLNVPSDSVHFIVIQSTSAYIHAFGIVASTSGGVLNIETMQTSQNITLTAGTGAITVDVGATARPLAILDFRMRGAGWCSLS